MDGTVCLSNSWSQQWHGIAMEFDPAMRGPQRMNPAFSDSPLVPTYLSSEMSQHLLDGASQN